LVLALFVGPAVATDPRSEDQPREGTVVRATADQLVMAARRWEVQVGATYRYRLAPGATVTCDGMLCNLQDLKPGQRVRVTARGGREWSIATRVEALDEQSAFPVAVARAQ
jgi:flagella basal body P-ring formation protein FlgA